MFGKLRLFKRLRAAEKTIASQQEYMQQLCDALELWKQHTEKLTTNFTLTSEKTQDQLNSVTQSILNATQAIAELEDKFAEMAKREQNVAVPDMLKYGKEPWCQLIGSEYDPDRGMGLSIDWNSAFIKQLREQGYSGINEMQIIGKWLAAVAASSQQSLGGE